MEKVKETKGEIIKGQVVFSSGRQTQWKTETFPYSHTALAQSQKVTRTKGIEALPSTIRPLVHNPKRAPDPSPATSSQGTARFEHLSAATTPHTPTSHFVRMGQLSRVCWISRLAFVMSNRNGIWATLVQYPKASWRYSLSLSPCCLPSFLSMSAIRHNLS